MISNKIVRTLGRRGPSSNLSYLVLTEEFPFSLKSTPSSLQVPKVEKFTLESGAKLVVSDRFSQRVSVQLAIGGGSSSESLQQKGSAHFLAQAAFVGNQKNTGVRLVRFLESLGASFSARADREKIVYELSVLPDDLEPALGGIVAAISSPPYEPYVYEEFKEEYTAVHGNTHAQLSTQVEELLHEAAFGESSGFGRPLYASNIDNLCVDEILAYRNTHFTRENLSVAVDGFPAEKAKSLVELYSKKIPCGKGRVPLTSSYIGGEVKVKSELTHGATVMGLAFAVPNGDAGKGHRVLALTLNDLLRSNGVKANTFFYNYANGGIFGFHLNGSTNATTAQLSSALEILKKLRSGSGSSLESLLKRAALLKQLSTEGCSRTTALLESLNGSVDLRSATKEDVQRAAAQIAKSIPAYVAFGVTHGTPSINAIQKQLE